MLQSWYQKTAQSPVNTLVSISWHNRLPSQHYELPKTPLILAFRAYISKMARWNVFIFLTFDKHDKMQLLAKFKKILYMGFRTTLFFRKFKVALSPMYRMFLNFVKICILSYLSKFDIKVTSHLRRSLSGSSEKISARPSFNKSLTNYISEQSLINGVYDKNIF